MSEARTFIGMRGTEVLRRLLQCEEKAGADSAESLLLELDGRGIAARMIRLQEGDLRYLEAPSLIELRDGTWLLLRGGNGRRLTIEDADRIQRAPAEAIEALTSGIALQIVQELPAGTSLWRRLGTLLFARRTVSIEVLVAGVIIMLLALIPPQLTRAIVDRALSGGAPSVVTLLAAAVVLVTFFQVWIGWLRARAILYLKTRTEIVLNHGFLIRLLNLPFAFLSRRTSGQLLQGFVGLGNAQDVLTERALGAVIDGAMAVLYLVVMMTIMPAPALVVLLAALAMVALAVVAAQRQATLQRDETEAQNEQRDYLVELLSGAATVKATGFEERALSEWMKRLSREIAAALARQRVSLRSDVVTETIRQAITIMVLIWGARLVLDGQTTTGSLLAFLQMSIAFMAAVAGLTGVWAAVAVLQPQLKIVTEALQSEARPRRSRVSPSLHGPVTLDDVWFRYDPSGPWTVHGLDLTVKAGEKRWIKGPSGSGKSTILRLIAGLYLPERGTIRVGGCDPTAANELVIYLPQFVHLYGASILDNLKIFSGHATRERLMEAAEASGLHAVVSALPMGYDTILPPGGATFSGGERQLVALTAVMASDRSLFLLDEALANLDWVSRSWIEKSRWFDGKTMIYASHDAGFGSDADAYIHMD